MSEKHTPGPLTVRIDPTWPFTIRTFDVNGSAVFSRSMPAFSTRDKSAADAIAGVNQYEDALVAQELNERAIADEVLRAAAPALLAALKRAEPYVRAAGVLVHLGDDLKIIQDAIAQANGEPS